MKIGIFPNMVKEALYTLGQVDFDSSSQTY